MNEKEIQKIEELCFQASKVVSATTDAVSWLNRLQRQAKSRGEGGTPEERKASELHFDASCVAAKSTIETAVEEAEAFLKHAAHVTADITKHAKRSVVPLTEESENQKGKK